MYKFVENEKELIAEIVKKGGSPSEDFAICMVYFRTYIKKNSLYNIKSRNIVYQNCLGFLNAFSLKNLITETEYEFLHEKLLEYQRYAQEV